MEFHTMESVRPPSKFMFKMALLMWISSTVCLWQKLSPLLWTVVLSQLIQWLVFWTWTAMPFLESPHLTACLCLPSLTFVSSWLIPHTPVSNPYKESCTPLLPVSVLGSLSLHASVLFSESSLVWWQAALPAGYRPSQSSRWAPWCKGCIRSWVHRPVLVVLRVQGEAKGGLLGPSLPGLLGTHSPGASDSGDPFPYASLWDCRCCVLCPPCTWGLP